MMVESCRQWRPALAAWVLGRLEGREADDLVAHLTGCVGCRAEISELTESAAALRLADPPPEGGRPEPPPELGDAVAARIAAERAAVRRKRVRAVAAAAAALILVAVVGVTWWPGVGEDEPERIAATVTEVADGLDASDATVEVEERGWGASVNITVSGLENGSLYRVWVEDAAGERHSAGTFLGIGEGEIHCYMAAATRLEDAAVVGIDDAEGAPVLRGSMPVHERAGRR